MSNHKVHEHQQEGQFGSLTNKVLNSLISHTLSLANTSPRKATAERMSSVACLSQ